MATTIEIDNWRQKRPRSQRVSSSLNEPYSLVELPSHFVKLLSHCATSTVPYKALHISYNRVDQYIWRLTLACALSRNQALSHIRVSKMTLNHQQWCNNIEFQTMLNHRFSTATRMSEMNLNFSGSLRNRAIYQKSRRFPSLPLDQTEIRWRPHPSSCQSDSSKQRRTIGRNST